MNVSLQSGVDEAASVGESELFDVLRASLYPRASLDSIRRVLSYCKVTGLDPMQKPVHIVPQWDGETNEMRELVVPGIGLYRTLAARSGCAGVSEPEFGPEVCEQIGGESIRFPSWCRITVKRRLTSGELAEFTSKELWKENFATERGDDGSLRPNAIWTKRPYGQLAKCAEAQALRKAFPEIGAHPVAEEMDGKDVITNEPRQPAKKPAVRMPKRIVGEAECVPVLANPEPPADADSVKPAAATLGEVSYLLKKLASKGMDVKAARAAAGIESSDVLDGLTKTEFLALRKVVA